MILNGILDLKITPFDRNENCMWFHTVFKSLILQHEINTAFYERHVNSARTHAARTHARTYGTPNLPKFDILLSTML